MVDFTSRNGVDAAHRGGGHPRRDRRARFPRRGDGADARRSVGAAGALVPLLAERPARAVPLPGGRAGAGPGARRRWPRMKVLVVHPLGLRFAGYPYIEEKVQALAPHGVEVAVVAPFKDETTMVDGRDAVVRADPAGLRSPRLDDARGAPRHHPLRAGPDPRVDAAGAAVAHRARGARRHRRRRDRQLRGSRAPALRAGGRPVPVARRAGAAREGEPDAGRHRPLPARHAVGLGARHAARAVRHAVPAPAVLRAPEPERGRLHRHLEAVGRSAGDALRAAVAADAAGRRSGAPADAVARGDRAGPRLARARARTRCCCCGPASSTPSSTIRRRCSRATPRSCARTPTRGS